MAGGEAAATHLRAPGEQQGEVAAHRLARDLEERLVRLGGVD